MRIHTKVIYRLTVWWHLQWENISYYILLYGESWLSSEFFKISEVLDEIYITRALLNLGNNGVVITHLVQEFHETWANLAVLDCFTEYFREFCWNIRLWKLHFLLAVWRYLKPPDRGIRMCYDFRMGEFWEIVVIDWYQSSVSKCNTDNIFRSYIYRQNSGITDGNLQ